MVTSMLEYLQGRFKSLEEVIEAEISAVEDKERKAASINKRGRPEEESIFNLESKDGAEGEFIRRTARKRGC